MSIIGTKRIRCRGKIDTLKLHKGPKGGKFIMVRKHGGGTKKKYI
jgi:hypothetical protein